MDPLAYHKHYKGKLAVVSKVPLESKEDLSTAYTPGVAEPCKEIAKNPELAYEYTNKGNFVAVVSDGTAVLGLGDIGPEAGLPVMEGKAILFKQFGNVDAFPICIRTKDTEEIIKFVKQLEPTFGGINLEDISAPRCFEIKERLEKELSIPVFHDDQDGTAIVVLAAVINAAKVVGKKLETLRTVIMGAGAAGIAIAKLLQGAGLTDVTLVDSVGIIESSRQDLNFAKKEMLKSTNIHGLKGDISVAMKDADLFIGVSKGNVLTESMVASMAKDSIVLAMANPTPEIMPDIALKAGARVVGTGRSDFPNQVNNVLVFPGLFRGVLDARAKNITSEMKLAAAHAIAAYVDSPNENMIIPQALDKNVGAIVAKAVYDIAIRTK